METIKISFARISVVHIRTSCFVVGDERVVANLKINVVLIFVTDIAQRI